MKFFQRHISILLLAAVSLFIAPKNLLHELLEHHGTEDEICADVGAHYVGKAHHHCDCLQLSSPPLYHSFIKFFLYFSETISIQIVHPTSEYHFSFSPCIFLRGPPSVN